MVNLKSLFDKATNPDHSEPDWETILEIVEEVKTKAVTVKNVVKEIRRKLLDSDPTVVFYSLLVLDSLMKNCTSDLHSEVLSSEFMNVLKGVITSSRDGRNAKAVDKALELIGEWKVAFGSQPGYKAVHNVFSELEREGYHIPEAEVASAAFIKKAPEWVMGERCFMCRQEFSKLKGNFRHHCRNCGKSVCAQCSSKKVPLPHYGVDQPARVCDLCYRDVDRPSTDRDNRDGDSSELPPEYLQSSLAHESQQPPSRNPDLQMQEDDDLQMAIAMSLNEQENKKQSAPARSVTPPLSTAPSAPPPPTSTLYSTIVHDTSSSTNRSTEPYFPGNEPTEETEADPNLARYLNRSYWEERREKQRTGAVPTTTPPASSSNDLGPQAVALTAGTVGSPLAESVRKTIELFLQRLHEVNVAGGSVATDPIVLSLYQNLNALQPQLLKQIDDIQQQKAHQERILQKLNEAKQARVSLNSMRHKHIEKLKQQEKEQAMLARMQMEQKLALLRQQKQEQDEYQQTLQQKRLDVLHSQRSDYEHQLQMQREMERQQLIMQEQQVLQQQFGGGTAVQPQAQPQMQPPQMQPPQMQPPQMQPPQMQPPQMQPPQMQPPQMQPPQMQPPQTQPQMQLPQMQPPQTQPQMQPPPAQMQPQMQPQVQPQMQQLPHATAVPLTQPQMQPQYGRVSPVQHTQPQYEPVQTHQFQPAAPPSLAPASLPLHSLSIHDPTQASPLPPKLDHNPNADPALPPPPYQPMSLQTDGGAYQQLQSYPTQLQPTSQLFASQPTTSLLDTNLTSFQPLSLSGSPQTLTSQPASLAQAPVQQQQQSPSISPAGPGLMLGQQPPPPQSIQPQSLVQGVTQPQFGPPHQPQGFQQPTQVFTPQQQVGYSTGYQQPPVQQYTEAPQQFTSGHPNIGMTQGGGFQRPREESEPPLITFD